MGLFDKKKSDLPPLISDAELIDYNSVIDWLVGLSDADYEKVCKVADNYRASEHRACEILEVENKPTTFISPPEPEIPEDDIPFLLDDELAKETKQKALKNSKVIINKKKR